MCSELLCVCAVLLAGLLSGGRGENGSSQTGKVSDCVKGSVTSNLTWTAFQYPTTSFSNHRRYRERLHEQLNESDDAAQSYMLYIQDIYSCGVSNRQVAFSTD